MRVIKGESISMKKFKEVLFYKNIGSEVERYCDNIDSQAKDILQSDWDNINNDYAIQ